MKARPIREKVFKHLLIADGKLLQRIEKSQRKYRPYLKSRNYFIIELIEVGLERLELQSKIYGGNYKEILRGKKKARKKYGMSHKSKGKGGDRK